MLPKICLQGGVDIAALSPLLRGMLLSVAYVDGEGGVGLTATISGHPQSRLDYHAPMEL